MQELFKHYRNQDKIKQAKDRFSWKPLFIRLENLYSTLKYSRLLFHAFSVLTGFIFMLELIQSIGINFYISFILSSFILVVIELVKSFLIEDTFNSFYNKNNSYIIVGLFACLFLGGSIYQSLNGAKKYHDKNTTTIEDNERVYNNAKDSITLRFLTAIQEVKEEEQAYIKSITWLGQIDIHNKTTKQKLASYDSRLNSLEAQKLESLDETKKAYSLGNLRALQENAFNSTLIICIAAINESIILLICWFMVFYDYSIFKESHIIEEVRPAYTQNIDDIKRFFNTYLSSTNTYQVLNENKQEDEPKIGFKSPSKTQVLTAETKEETNKDLILDLKNGIRDTRYLLKTHKVNLIVLNRVKKSLGITSKKAKK